MIVKYRRLYPYAPYLNEEIGYERSIPDDATEDQMIEAVVKLKEVADKAHRKINPDIQPALTDFNTGQSTASDILNPHEGIRLQKLIEESKTPDELDKLYDDAVKYGLSPTWDTKLRSLKQQ